MKTNHDTEHATFKAALVAAYSELFKISADYAYSASKTTPEILADRMFAAVLNGSANVTGSGFRMACKACGINHTGKAIDTYLGIEKPASVKPVAKPRKVSTLILSRLDSMMTAVWRINYAHGLAVLEYSDGSRESAKLTDGEWLAVADKPLSIVSLVQSKRVPATV